jgi:hypothetical protein
MISGAGGPTGAAVSAAAATIGATGTAPQADRTQGTHATALIMNGTPGSPR